MQWDYHDYDLCVDEMERRTCTWVTRSGHAQKWGLKDCGVTRVKD